MRQPKPVYESVHPPFLARPAGLPIERPEPRPRSRARATLLCLLVLQWAMAAGLAQAAPKVSRVLYDKAGRLVVKGKSSSPVRLYDADQDQWLASSPPGKFTFRLDALPQPPCLVRLEDDQGAVTKEVRSKTRCPATDLPPRCSILSPAADATVAFGGSLRFTGEAVDPNQTALHYEWDFAGGADVRPLAADAGNVTFNVRDDTEYRVRFIATDVSGRRCAASVKVTVGTPPVTPAKVAEQAPPGAAAAGDGNHVVIPFTPLGMQFHDQNYQRVAQQYPTNWLNAIVVRKGSIGDDKPRYLTPEQVELRYSAASNPRDPAGVGSINSTSQNYPAGALFQDALVKKSDFWDPCLKSSEGNLFIQTPLKPATYDGVVTNANCAFGNLYYAQYNGFSLDDPGGWSFFDLKPDQGQWFWDSLVFYNPDHKYNKLPYPGLVEATGVPMPGIAGPYVANEPQAAFKAFDADTRVFKANGLVQFPTDDQGRHNAYPMMRVQARDKSSGKLLATTDAVMAVSTEFHCAECHTYGKIGADQSIFDALRREVEASTDPDLEKYKGRLQHIPEFVRPEDVDAARKDQRDVIEQAALINMTELHDFTYNFVREINIAGQWPTPLKPFFADQPMNCGSWCHRSENRVGQDWGAMAPEWVTGDAASHSCPEFSMALHNTHGRFMGKLNADFTGSIERDPVTRTFKLLDLTQDIKTQPAPLLQAKDAGTPDESCFFCHQGKQDKYQRDVMSKAGVNCIDCHGDLVVQAGASAMAGRTPGGAANPNGPGEQLASEFRRIPWVDMPSCGSCHTGHGDEPVKRRAYDMTTTEFRPLKPVTERFAENVAPKLAFYDEHPSNGYYGFYTKEQENGQSCPPGTFSDTIQEGGKSDCSRRERFRDSLDRHAKLPCASCHGSPHAIWPNPDPYANDNVTAMQLQGHAGNITECTVCHTEGSFAAGTLDGPHNIHSLGDSRWVYNDNADNTPEHRNSHLNFARASNTAKAGGGVDECAACHGDDHRGTRLSRAMTDRVLTIADPRQKGSLKPGSKWKVSVKKGDVIGCDLCHGLDMSFKQ